MKTIKLIIVLLIICLPLNASASDVFDDVNIKVIYNSLHIEDVEAELEEVKSQLGSTEDQFAAFRDEMEFQLRILRDEVEYLRMNR